MALELKKQSMETERIISAQKTQVNLQAEAMVSGAGRDAVEILMEDAVVRITGTEVQNGRMSVDGVAVCQAAYRQGDSDVIRAVEARAQLRYAFESEAIAMGMNASAEATVVHVETGYLNGRILFHVTVELCGTVTCLSTMETVTRIEGVSGIECDTQQAISVRCSAEATAQTSLSETLSLPSELGTQATLMDYACITVEKVEKDLGGVMVSGKVEAEVMITGSIPGKPAAMVKYPIPYRQLVQMPEWLSEDVQAFAEVESIRSALVQNGDEMQLRIDADVAVRVRAFQRQEISCICNAYATGETDIRVETQPVHLTSEIERKACAETFRGTVLIPEGMPPVGSVLAARVRPMVTGMDGDEVEGVLEAAVMYMPSGGDRPLTIRDELPFRIHCTGGISGCAAVSCIAASCEASALMNDRIELRCGLRFSQYVRKEQKMDIVVAAHEQPAQPRKPGIVICWPANDDTAWSIGRRYRIPMASVIGENGGESIVSGKALILRT